MPRIARIVIPHLPHHITKRGNNRQEIFHSDQDRQLFIDLLRYECKRHGLAIAGYCLMPNHIHLVAIPDSKKGFQNGIGRTSLRYTQRFNKQYERIGHLWQERFYSCPLDDDHFYYSLRYVEQNPVRAGFVDLAWDYPWSSAAAHVGQRDTSRLLDLDWWCSFQDLSEWAELLQSELPEAIKNRLRKYAKTGRPLGSEEFIDNLESAANCRLRALPVGRPRKNCIR